MLENELSREMYECLFVMEKYKEYSNAQTNYQYISFRRATKTALKKWLNIESLVEVEISSEDVDYPIESALLPGNTSGWRALDSGKQSD